MQFYATHSTSECQGMGQYSKPDHFLYGGLVRIRIQDMASQDEGR
jgi:hypothetical protein